MIHGLDDAPEKGKAAIQEPNRVSDKEALV